jgi:hypothetical protein
MKQKKYMSIGLVSLSAIMALYELVLYILDAEANEILLGLSATLFLFFLILWISADSKLQNIYRPYDYEFIIYMFWVLYLPYYFIKTRGARGIFWLLGILVLYNLGLLLQWGFYFIY